MTRTLVLGLDGATFDVLDPLISDGVMPTLAELRDSGASGTLQSTIPPVTGPAWLSLATGLTPGSTGIYDFINRDPDADGFDMTYIDWEDYRGRAVWDYLSDAGNTVGVVDYPTLSNPYDLDGFMIAGGLGSKSHSIAPVELEDSLREFDKPKGHLDLSNDDYETDLSAFMDDILENLERRVTIVEHVLAEKSWDFCWAVFQEPDWVQHMMWKVHDSEHFEADSVTERERELWREFWSTVDNALARCLALVDENTNVLIQSDHGFGPRHNRSLRINKWLVDEGYMIPKNAAGSHYWLKKRIRNLLTDVAKAVNLSKWAPNLFEWGRQRTLSFSIQLNAVDLNRTKVFDPGHIGTMGGLYVNERVVDPAAAGELLSEIETKLRQFGDQNGLDFQIDYPEQLYGHATETSPDMIVRVPGTQIEDGDWDEETPVIGNRPNRLSQQSGSHRQDGVLIAAGPDFKETTFDEADVFDLAPTLLHCHGVSVPTSMDGKVLTDLLAQESEVQYAASGGTDSPNTHSDEDRDGLEEQLSNLGYFE